jgi:hypothetical protein
MLNRQSVFPFLSPIRSKFPILNQGLSSRFRSHDIQEAIFQSPSYSYEQTQIPSFDRIFWPEVDWTLPPAKYSATHFPVLFSRNALPRLALHLFHGSRYGDRADEASWLSESRLLAGKKDNHTSKSLSVVPLSPHRNSDFSLDSALFESFECCRSSGDTSHLGPST